MLYVAKKKAHLCYMWQNRGLTCVICSKTEGSLVLYVAKKKAHLCYMWQNRGLTCVICSKTEG